jgi:hypothetical protein
MAIVLPGRGGGGFYSDHCTERQDESYVMDEVLKIARDYEMLIGKVSSCPFHRSEFPFLTHPRRAVGWKIQSECE